jgi:hypothetical protein
MKQSNTQTVIHNSYLYQRYIRSSVKHNHIFSLNQLHVSAIYSYHQASHKRENKYTNTFGAWGLHALGKWCNFFFNFFFYFSFVNRASRYNCVKKNYHDARPVLSIFRQPVHVSGVSRVIIRRYNHMYTTIGTYTF